MLFSLTPPINANLRPPDPGQDTVVVLHGMGRTKLSMRWLASRLGGDGYAVLNLSYPSTKYPVARLADLLHHELEARGLDHTRRTHFVTHSLGGIVVRAYLKEHRPANLGCVVMLSPPNQGSEVADRLRRHSFYRLATGPAGQELGTDAASTPQQLGPVDFPLGVITGDKSFNPLFSHWIPGRSDGKVSVERAKVEGMTDFLVVPHSHSFIMRSGNVAMQVAHFLKCRSFNRTPA